MITSYEEIAQKAFDIWTREGRPKGREQDHWLRAEAELRKEKLKDQTGHKVTSQDSSMLKTPKR